MRPIGAPGQIPDRFYVISLADFCGWGKDVSPGETLQATRGDVTPTQTFLGVRHAFLPHERLLKQAVFSFPIVRKHQSELTSRLTEKQSELLKSKCWKAICS